MTTWSAMASWIWPAPDARRIYAGKEASNHTLPQDSINQLLVDLANEGLSVVRLKGGDPSSSGAAAKNWKPWSASGIPFEVVPGVTAAAGCAAYAGFPLTHRDHAQAVTFSSPATSRTARSTSTGPRFPAPNRPSSSTWASALPPKSAAR
jgi:siroheme synthase